MRAPTAASPKPMFEGLGPGFVKQPVPVPGLSLYMCGRKVWCWRLWHG
uniref:IGSF8 protein n=1 Tax=Homo sapiens TaxID=9606 RepID=Q96EW3_HUMAN|nr:IGSF8 protein [Homo sapiens]